MKVVGAVHASVRHSYHSRLWVARVLKILVA